MFGSHMTDNSYNRATSLDPSTLSVRTTPFHMPVSVGYGELTMGQSNVPGNEPLVAFGTQGHADASDMANVDTTEATEPKTNLADEYTNWEQHNA
jgi:hypothetical protein